MFRKLRFLVSIVLLAAYVTGHADDGKSFSRRMNEIKRSGDYIYAEASAPTESQAKTACDELLKIEITKYMAEGAESDSKTRIVRDLGTYRRDYISQARGDLIRVFGFIAKSEVKAPGSGVEAKSQSSKIQEVASESAIEHQAAEVVPAPAPAPVAETQPTTEPKPAPSPAPTPTVAQAPTAQPAAAPATRPVPAPQESSTRPTALQPERNEPSQATSSIGLKTDGLQLARWQIEMLENIVAQPDPTEAKKLLNRYRTQHRIKRLGDNSAQNPRPAESYYLVYDGANKPVAVLAPADSATRYDLISGNDVNINNFKGYQTYWFQISQ